ncbi:MAG: hypothetical protein CMF42_03055 [Legionellales bacterium]|nr:hypothetical protein [Legionellales bacterium]OUX67749.1 MAG: hypothetical protein CBD38_01920 [bacterium TMED178]
MSDRSNGRADMTYGLSVQTPLSEEILNEIPISIRLSQMGAFTRFCFMTLCGALLLAVPALMITGFALENALLLTAGIAIAFPVVMLYVVSSDILKNHSHLTNTFRTKNQNLSLQETISFEKAQSTKLKQEYVKLEETKNQYQVEIAQIREDIKSKERCLTSKNQYISRELITFTASLSRFIGELNPNSTLAKRLKPSADQLCRYILSNPGAISIYSQDFYHLINELVHYNHLNSKFIQYTTLTEAHIKKYEASIKMLQNKMSSINLQLNRLYGHAYANRFHTDGGLPIEGFKPLYQTLIGELQSTFPEIIKEHELHSFGKDKGERETISKSSIPHQITLESYDDPFERYTLMSSSTLSSLSTELPRLPKHFKKETNETHQIYSFGTISPIVYWTGLEPNNRFVIGLLSIVILAMIPMLLITAYLLHIPMLLNVAAIISMPCLLQAYIVNDILNTDTIYKESDQHRQNFNLNLSTVARLEEENRQMQQHLNILSQQVDGIKELSDELNNEVEWLNNALSSENNDQANWEKSSEVVYEAIQNYFAQLPDDDDAIEIIVSMITLCCDAIDHKDSKSPLELNEQTLSDIHSSLFNNADLEHRFKQYHKESEVYIHRMHNSFSTLKKQFVEFQAKIVDEAIPATQVSRMQADTPKFKDSLLNLHLELCQAWNYLLGTTATEQDDQKIDRLKKSPSKIRNTYLKLDQPEQNWSTNFFTMINMEETPPQTVYKLR